MTKKINAPHQVVWEKTQHSETRRDKADCRTQYSREYARLIHSSAFRRLQSKTQVLGLGESDFYRTRLTHSLEVMQIGGGIVDFLRTKLKSGSKLEQNISKFLPDDKLIEAICLAHDLGHPPFGHGGEVALNYCMLDYGGFEGNGQTLRILSKLEKFRKGYGINPSRRLLLGILKYPAPYSAAVNQSVYPSESEIQSTLFCHLKSKMLKPPKCFLDDEKDVVDWILCELSTSDRELFGQVDSVDRKHHETKYKGFDTSIMEIADDIAYGAHDLEDGIALGLITISNWCDSELIKAIPKTLQKRHELFGRELFDTDLYVRKHAIGSLVHFFIKAVRVHCNEEFSEPLLSYNAALPPPYKSYLKVLKGIANTQMINNPNVKLLELKGRNITVELFNAFASDPETYLLPGEVQKYTRAHTESERKRVICDFIAGMTDDYAIKMHNKIFLPSHGSIFDKI